MCAASENRRLRIAISGGGLAGATLINALMKHAHLDVHIYESAAEFSERGAAVGLAANAQAALSEIGPEVREALERAGAVLMNSSRAIVGAGPNAGTIIFDLANKNQGRVVHRASFLGELLKAIPKEMMHTSKKLVKIDSVATGEILLSFQDGSKEYVDALIGADGVHGYVREYVLGAGHPALNPTFAGFWDCRSLVPIEKARELLGDEYFKEARQYAWSGNGGFFMHDVLDNGQTIQCVASVMTDEEWHPDSWKRDIDRRTLEETFATWTNSPVVKGMIELLLESPEPRAFAQWDHSEDAPTYANGPVCIMGDAAHAMTPWQGSGAGQAIEDAMILETLLEEVREPRQLDAAFKAYDAVRRPRTQKIVASSKITGHIICGRGPGIGLDVDKLREALASRWNFIYGLDMKEHKKAALAAMN